MLKIEPRKIRGDMSHHVLEVGDMLKDGTVVVASTITLRSESTRTNRSFMLGVRVTDERTTYVVGTVMSSFSGFILTNDNEFSCLADAFYAYQSQGGV